MNLKDWKHKRNGLFIGVIFMLIGLVGGTNLLVMPFFIFMLIADSIAASLLSLGFSESPINGNVYVFFFYGVVYLLLLICFLLFIRFHANNTVNKVVLASFFVLHFFVASLLCYFFNFILNANFSENYNRQDIELFLAIPKSSILYPLYGFLFDIIIKHKNKEQLLSKNGTLEL